MRVPEALIPKATPLTGTALLELRNRHVAFLLARLVSDQARLEWRANLEAGWSALLATPVERLVTGAAAADLVDASLGRPAFRDGLRPAVRSALLLTSARLREDPRRLGDYVPADLRARLDELLEQRGIVPEHLLREVMEHDAVEEVMRDVLFDTLKEFSEKEISSVAWCRSRLLLRRDLVGPSCGRGRWGA